MKLKSDFTKFGFYLLILALLTLATGSVWAADKTEIRIGTPLPVTGILAGGTLEQKWAYEQAVSYTHLTLPTTSP